MSYWIQKLFRSKKDRPKSPQTVPIEPTTDDASQGEAPRGLTKMMGFNDSLEILKTKPKKSIPALEVIKTGMLEESRETEDSLPTPPISFDLKMAPRPSSEQNIRQLANTISSSLDHAISQVKSLRDQLESFK